MYKNHHCTYYGLYSTKIYGKKCLGNIPENSQNPRPSHSTSSQIPVFVISNHHRVASDMPLVSVKMPSRSVKNREPGSNESFSSSKISKVRMTPKKFCSWLRVRWSNGDDFKAFWAKRPNQKKYGWIKIGYDLFGACPKIIRQQICDSRNYWKSSPRHDGVCRNLATYASGGVLLDFHRRWTT